MANYVWNRIFCDKDTLDKYFIDDKPFGDDIVAIEPYITFNKLFGVGSLNEYSEKIGTDIYYGYGSTYRRQEDGRYEVLFVTRWYYPIEAIKEAVLLSHNLEWYAVEENCIYVSKFYWNNGVKEDVMMIEDGYYEWLDVNMDFNESLEDPDFDVWYYLRTVKENWRNWESNDDFKRYKDSTPCIYKSLGEIGLIAEFECEENLEGNTYGK